MRVTRTVGILAVVAACAWGAPPAAADDRPHLEVGRISREPRIEEFLDMRAPDDLARQMTRVTGFVQREPEDGRPASQRTVVWLGYDDARFHAVFVAFDEAPDRMRAHWVSRENIRGEDTVEIQLDTFADRRRAYSFLTNARGVQWDAIWTEGSEFDVSWDAVWESEGRLTDAGYVVHMAIPFESLRFPPESEQTWNVVLVRDIPRNDEVSFWPAVSSRIEGRLNQSATLSGLRGISPGRNVSLIPYVTGRGFRLLDDATLADARREPFEGDAGLDAKFVIRDSLTLDLTANPDFAQVESDRPQITANERFDLFFPERRPFFIENAGFFETPLTLLFTRRIEDPRVGARLTGRLGDYALGLLVADDEAPGIRAPPGDPLHGEDAVAGVFRLVRNVSEQSSVGVLWTERRLADSRNRVASVDARVKLDANWVGRWQIVHSRDEDVAGAVRQDQAYSFEFNRSGRHWNQHLHYREVGPEFDTKLGFVPRLDERNLHNDVSWRFWPEGRRLVSWGPGLLLVGIEDADGQRLEWRTDPRVTWNLRGQTEFSIGWERGEDTVRPADFPALAAPTTFRVSRVRLSGETRTESGLDLSATATVGDGANFVPPVGSPPTAARTASTSVELTVRPGRRLSIANTWLHGRVRDDTSGGGTVFRNDIVRTRWNVQFNREWSLRLIAQFEETDAVAARTRLASGRRLNGDVLLTYLVNPWTAAYLGYNSNHVDPLEIEDPMGNTVTRPRRGFVNDARAVFFKLSWLFRP